MLDKAAPSRLRISKKNFLPLAVNYYLLVGNFISSLQCERFAQLNPKLPSSINKVLEFELLLKAFQDVSRGATSSNSSRAFRSTRLLAFLRKCCQEFPNSVFPAKTLFFKICQSNHDLASLRREKPIFKIP